MWLQINNVAKLNAPELAQGIRSLLHDAGVSKPDVHPDMYYDEFDFENWTVVVRVWQNLDPEKEDELRQAVVDFCASRPGGGLRVVNV